MNSDLDAIVSADEEARIRIVRATGLAEARLEDGRAACARRERDRLEVLGAALAAEERRIAEDTDRAVADRQARRAKHLEARRLAAEGALARAAECFAEIVRNGPPLPREP